MKYFVLGDEDTVLGFGMAGVNGIVVSDANEAQIAFRNVLKDRETGIIIITEKTADLIRNIINEFIFREQFPLIVEIPDRNGPDPRRPGIREMVNASIGVNLS
ncbi:MAG: Vacuolar H+transporting two-sector ATPase F subunit [Chitinivibrionales bacterium]|nr:Vacuolar H+transporting two-sector ATPase F subunit [Chitinivibrionales bacterium]